MPIESRHYRTTPRRLGARDYVIFPEAYKRQKECRCPTYYYLRVGKRRSTITFDGFFLPVGYPERLEELYRAYVHWWCAKTSPERKYFPRSLGWGSPMRDYVSVTVLTDHLDWWVGLFRLLSPLAYNAWEAFRWEGPDRESLEWARRHGVLS